MPRFGVCHERPIYEVTEKAARPNIFYRLRGKGAPNVSQKEVRLKNWEERDLKKLIYSVLDDKIIYDTKNTIDLVRKNLGEEQRSAFSQEIIDAPPPKKFSPPKFNTYNGQTNPADHVHYFK